MKKILITGGSGFVGSNIIRVLEKKYNITAPRRSELDLKDREAVEKYVKVNNFDTIVHLASPTPVRSPQFDNYEHLLEDCVKVFMNIYAVREFCDKIIYSGSGAEFDKRRDIISVSEDEIGEKIPTDDYGIAKYLINSLICESDNLYNLRIFGCFGQGEYASKFITHAVRCALRKEPITIRQDCIFDYLYIDNYAMYIDYFIDNLPQYHDYNAASGRRIALSEIANIVNQKLENKSGYIIAEQNIFNKEYSADCSRILQETKLANKLISLEDGIDKLIIWEKQKYEAESC